MSYPMDNNPWDDDNYRVAGNNPTYGQQQPQSYGGYNTGSGGYNNPVNQYYDGANPTNQNQDPSYQYDWNEYTGHEQQDQGAQQTGPEQPAGYESQQGIDDQTAPKAGRERSAFQRFLSAHIPLCGTLFDTCSSINLPFIDALVQHINKDLLVSKMFYFFFYSAFGSLFPLMGVYFKQLGMNPSQVGILTGVRPFIEIFSAPFWNNLAERFHKSKALLIFSLFSWIIFTYSLAHIRPPPTACIAFNDTDYVLYVPYSRHDLSNVDPNQFTDEQQRQEAELEAKESATGRGNEMYIERMTQAKNGAARRKRQVEVVREFSDLSRGADLPDVDIENDFEDQYISRESIGRRAQFRYKRDTKDDDILGASEETEAPEESTEHNRSNEDDSGENEGLATEEDDSNNIEPDKSKQLERVASVSSAKTSPTELTSSEASEINLTQKSTDDEPGDKAKRIFRQRHRTPPTHIVGKSPITVEYAVNYNKAKDSQSVTPMFSTLVFKLDDIKGVFFLLLLLICLGEFFSAPALTLADSATLRYLGDNTDSYGRQRMFGSFSWAVTLLLVGMALDNATSIADHPCGPHLRERNYNVCFIIFSLLMACALMTATQFRFDYQQNGANKNPDNQAVVVSQTSGDNKVVTTVASANTVDDLYASTQPRSIFNTAPPINEPPPSVQQKTGGKDLEFLEKWRSAVFAQRTRKLPEWVNVFRQFSHNSLHLTYLFITWFLGCGVGLVFTFLFWHLQDVGGTPTLFGICSVINHISEILAYFFSFSFIKRFGHTRVLSVGLGCNAARFLYVAFLTNPYYALPFELVQGITHAACFAACCSYISQKSKPELKTSTQGVMQGLHHGVGRACGALLGGFMINAIGSRASFCIYGLLSGCVLGGFLHVRKKASAEELEEADVKVDDSDALGGYGAPQGVPSAITSKIQGAQSNVNQPEVQEMINYQW